MSFNKFYIYSLHKDDGTIFYVGKGSGRRKNVHFTKCHNRHADFLIKKQLRENKTPYSEIIKDDLYEYEAFELEEFIIECVGRQDLKTGPLCNFTNGGEGVSGIIFSDKEKSRRKEYATNNPVWKDGVPPPVRNKISDSLKGKMKGKDNPFYGKTHSPENLKKMSGDRPSVKIYNHPRIRSDYKSLQCWLKADFYYTKWIELNKPKAHKFCSNLQVDYLNSFTNIIKHFNNGWIPFEDKNFKLFKEEYTTNV